MASIKAGQITKPPAHSAWWKHLRWTKRMFWKAERKAAKRAARSDD